MESDLQTLNEQFAIPGELSFQIGQGGLVMAVINNDFAIATLTLAGGHLMTYTPHGSKPVLWVSPHAAHTLGKAMRGGVPVCWPWFADQTPTPLTGPMHGLVRTMLWSLSGTRTLPDGSTEVRLVVRDTPETLALWPHTFELELCVTVGARLRLAWAARNPGPSPYQYTGALHPYFAVSDIRSVRIHGLDGARYLDKNAAMQAGQQPGPLVFDRPVDAIFLDATAELVIEDPGFKRSLHIAKTGSRTSVVWNPQDQDASMPDVGEGQHRYFVCAEAANAADDVVTVEPGGEGCLSMEIWASQEE